MQTKTRPSRIELERRGREIHEIIELNLDNCRTFESEVEGLTEEYVNLEVLSLINTGLRSLQRFPKLPNLRRLELSDNRISGGLDKLAGCPKLTNLNLSGNNIKDFESLKDLVALRSLKTLDLFNCEVTTLDGYRSKVFKILPQLKSLDGYDQNDKEADDDDDELGDDDDDDDDEVEDGEDDGLDEEDDDDDDDDDEEGPEDEDDDDDDDDDELGEEEEEEEDGQPGIGYLYQQENLEDDSEGEEFEPGEGEDEEDVEEEEVEENAQRGEKRKHEDEEEEA